MSWLCIRWPKNWSFSFSISPSNEYSGLISFRMDWLDILAVQGTLKSVLQYHSSKAVSVLQRSAFFMVQLSHPYMTTGKTIALTKWTFVDKGVTSGKESAHLCRRLKRGLLPGKKVMTNLDSILKCRNITYPQGSVYSRLWFFQWSCINVRVGL